MSKKTKAKLPTFTVNGYRLSVDRSGNLVSIDGDGVIVENYATAAEIAAIAEHSTIARAASDLPSRTEVGYDVEISDDGSGDVQFGCQTIGYADVQRIAKLSAAARSRKRTARRRAAAPAA